MERWETAAPPPAVLVTGHFTEGPGYATYRARGAGSWLVTYTLDGRGLYRQPPDLEVTAEPGDLVLLDPHALHDYSVPPEGRWQFLWAHFQPRPAWLSWWRLPEVGRGLWKLHLDSMSARDRAEAAFSRLHRESSISEHRLRNLDLHRELALNGLEEVMLVAALESARSSPRRLDPRVQRVLDRIASDLPANHSIQTLAEDLALSPSRLSHLFKSEVGDSITNFILTARLQRAAQLLELTSHGIGKISDELGFGSPFYFSRLFRRRFGLSPLAFRQRAQSGRP